MHHKLMTILGITLAGIMSASFMPAANAATGTDFTEVRDGVAIVHPGTINTVDVGTYLADGEWACKADLPDSVGGYADNELGTLVLTPIVSGKFAITWWSCSKTAPAVMHALELDVYDVNPIVIKALSRTPHHHKYLYGARNANSVVTWQNGDVALDNEAICMYGSFNKPRPEGQFVFGTSGSTKFKSRYNAAELDWVCYATQDGADMGFHSSSMGNRMTMPKSGVVWGRTFGSRSSVG